MGVPGKMTTEAGATGVVVVVVEEEVQGVVLIVQGAIHLVPHRPLEVTGHPCVETITVEQVTGGTERTWKTNDVDSPCNAQYSKLTATCLFYIQ